MAQQGPGQRDSGQQGPAQRDLGQQVPAGQGPAGKAGAEGGSTGHQEAPRDDSPAGGHDAHPAKSQGGTSANSAASPSKASAGARGPGMRNVAVLGPFTVRDLTVFAATLILFIASLIPMFAVRYNLWNLGSLFFLGLGIVLPLILAALFVARRVAPETKVRIGSLSIDQFGSVVASFAVAFFFLSVAGAFTPSLLVALIGALVLFAATVLARFIPFFAGDFLDRAEVPAHIAARESAVPARESAVPARAPKAAKAPKPAKPTEQGPAAGVQKAADRIFGGQKFGGKSAAQAPGTGAATAGTPAAGTPTAGTPAAGTAAAGAGMAPSAGAWPAANAASSAAASPETGPAAVVPSAEAPTAARPLATEPATPAAEETQLDGTPVTAAAAAGAGTESGNQPAGTGAGTGTGAVTGSAASATPATAVHPQVKPQEQVKSQEPIGATVDPATRPEETEEQPVHEAFWFAVAQHRTAVDERTGAPLFGIEPGGWVLALEDRGDEFLVQHTDGRVGVLRDLSNIERG
ncbi:hypothetical protein J7I89_03210 [Arthrobacter sp. ISL-5]|nr:hypothetical protein [Arthrobacter sp. ISL-5]